MNVDDLSADGAEVCRVGKQVRHADKSGIPVVVLAGSDEFTRGVVGVKQMLEPAFDSEASREAWLAARQGQREVPRGEHADAVRRAAQAGEAKA